MSAPSISVDFALDRPRARLPATSTLQARRRLTNILPRPLLALVGPYSPLATSVDMLFSIRRDQVAQVQIADRALHDGSSSAIEALSEMVGCGGRREGRDGEVAGGAGNEIVESGGGGASSGGAGGRTRGRVELKSTDRRRWVVIRCLVGRRLGLRRCRRVRRKSERLVLRVGGSSYGLWWLVCVVLDSFDGARVSSALYTSVIRSQLTFHRILGFGRLNRLEERRTGLERSPVILCE